jgi:hypothetical protein
MYTISKYFLFGFKKKIFLVRKTLQMSKSRFGFFYVRFLNINIKICVLHTVIAMMIGEVNYDESFSSEEVI